VEQRRERQRSEGSRTRGGDEGVAEHQRRDLLPLGEQDRERPGERLRKQDRIGRELELRRDTLGELRVPEGFAWQRDDFRAHRHGSGTHEVVEQRTCAIETRQQHDAAHRNPYYAAAAFASVRA
jgi:hypothetical protein